MSITQQQAVQTKGESLKPSETSRSWGTITCMGTAYNETIVNFNPSDGSQYQTVIVPQNLSQYALVALQDKMTVLASFDGPLGAYVTITDILIYN